MNSNHSLLCLTIVGAMAVGSTPRAWAQANSTPGMDRDLLIKLVEEGERFRATRMGGFSVSYAVSIEMPPPQSDVDPGNHKKLRFVHTLSQQGEKWRHETSGVQRIRGNTTLSDNTSVETYNGEMRRLLLPADPREPGGGSGHIWGDNTLSTSLNYASFAGAINGRPLSQFLTEHIDALNVSTTGSDLQVTVDQKDGSRFIMILDPEKAFQVRERRLYDSSGQLQSTMTTRFMKLETEGIWIPQQAAIEQQTNGPDGTPRLASRIVLEPIDTKNVQCNKDFPEDQFQVPFPEGTHVTDHVTGIRYVAGALDTMSLDNLAAIGTLFGTEPANAQRVATSQGVRAEAARPSEPAIQIDLSPGNVQHTSAANAETTSHWSSSLRARVGVGALVLISIGMIIGLIMVRRARMARCMR